MKNYKVTLEEYKDYLTELKSTVYKILPLYEEENEFLISYIDEVLDEIINVKNIIENLPNGYWYIKTLANVESLQIKIIEDNHSIVRKKVLNTTNLIQKEILNLETLIK